MKITRKTLEVDASWRIVAFSQSPLGPWTCNIKWHQMLQPDTNWRWSRTAPSISSDELRREWCTAQERLQYKSEYPNSRRTCSWSPWIWMLPCERLTHNLHPCMWPTYRIHKMLCEIKREIKLIKIEIVQSRHCSKLKIFNIEENEVSPDEQKRKKNGTNLANLEYFLKAIGPVSNTFSAVSEKPSEGSFVLLHTSCDVLT